jgi:hypothetical protein
VKQIGYNAIGDSRLKSLLPPEKRSEGNERDD